MDVDELPIANLRLPVGEGGTHFGRDARNDRRDACSTRAKACAGLAMRMVDGQSKTTLKSVLWKHRDRPASGLGWGR